MLGNSFKEYSEIYTLLLSSNLCDKITNSESSLVLSGNFFLLVVVFE